MTLPPLPELRTAAQAAHIALTCISTHPTLDMSDYLRGRVDAAAAGLEAALAAVPAQPVSDELIESLWYDAQRAWGEQTSVHPGEHVIFARLLERRIAAATLAVSVPAGLVLVPVDPTEAMLKAGLDECEPLGSLIDWDEGFGRDEMRDTYRAMLAAAPKEQP